MAKINGNYEVAYILKPELGEEATAALVAGGTELTSAALLAPMIGKSTAAAAIVIWRAVTFYFYLVAGGPVFAVLAGRPLLKKLISSREASS